MTPIEALIIARTLASAGLMLAMLAVCALALLIADELERGGDR